MDSRGRGMLDYVTADPLEKANERGFSRGWMMFNDCEWIMKRVKRVKRVMRMVMMNLDQMRRVHYHGP